MNFICPKGHRHKINWQDFRAGAGCFYCYGTKKYDFGYVKKFFEGVGYKLISDYGNVNEKLKYICPKGHKHSITFSHFKNGTRCPYCKKLKVREEDVVTLLAKCGYTLLDKYKSTRKKIKLLCPNNHVFNIRYDDFKSGRRCPLCYKDKKIAHKKRKLKLIKEEFEKEKYTLLSETYESCDHYLKCICPEGHKYKTRYINWKLGKRCRRCYEIKNTGPSHHSWRGGVSILPYCDAWADKEYKEDIKRRDNFTCQNPYCYGTSDKLVIHHIDYTKTICGPDNLITICNSCNSKANFDRKWHTEWYRTIMTNKYGYKYE